MKIKVNKTGKNKMIENIFFFKLKKDLQKK